MLSTNKTAQGPVRCVLYMGRIIDKPVGNGVDGCWKLALPSLDIIAEDNVRASPGH